MRSLTTLALALAMVAAACGSGRDSGALPATESTTTTIAPATTTTEATTPSIESSTTLPASGTEPADLAAGLIWHLMAEPPDLDTLRQLVPGCCWNIAFTDGAWSGGWGDSFNRGFSVMPTPSEIGPLRSIAANGALEMVAVPDTGPTIEPFVAVKEAPGAGAWSTVALPLDITNLHSDETLLYTVWTVAFDQWGHDYVVYGTASPQADKSGTTAGVVWTFHRPRSPAPWGASQTVLFEGVGTEFFLETGVSKTDTGFVLLTSRADGSGYDAWTSPAGWSWTSVGSDLTDVADVAVWGERILILTARGSVLELERDGTLTTLTAELPGNGETEPAQPVRIEAGDAGIVVVGNRDQMLSSGGDPVPTAQVLWFSPDGSTWSVQEISDLFGEGGAIDLMVTRHSGHQATPPTVIVALGTDQANKGTMFDPQWWVGRPAS